MEKKYDQYLNYSVSDFMLDEEYVNWIQNRNEDNKEFFSGLAVKYPLLDQSMKDAAVLLNTIETKIPENDEVTKNRIWKAVINDFKKSKVIPFTKYKYWLVAASVLVFLFFGAYVIFNKNGSFTGQKTLVKNQILKNDVAPGGNKATLQLADGTTIVLDSSSNGNIARQGKTKIIKINGQVAYNATGNSSEILYNKIFTPRGGQYQLILSDGTKVWLNAASSLHFPTNFTGTERKVTLTGEGYFEVAKNAQMPFKVDVAGKGVVEVLGTHFNVNAYEDEPAIKTTLLEGKVATNFADQKLVITPNEQVSYITSTSVSTINKDIDGNKYVAWKDGIFNFEDDDITDIMRQIARWYNVQIQYNGKMTSQHFTGVVRRQVPLSQVLVMLKQAGGVEFKVVGNNIEVNTK